MGLGPRLNAAKPKVAPTPPLKIESRVGIKAPAEVVWEILSDLDHWGGWSPIYPKASGTLRIGASLELTLALPGEAHRQIYPRVIDWVPYEQILWSDIGWRGWAKGMRFFEIEAVAREACFFSNGEVFEGMVSRWYGNSLRRAMKTGFASMGERLKELAEQRWAERA